MEDGLMGPVPMEAPQSAAIRLVAEQRQHGMHHIKIGGHNQNVRYHSIDNTCCLDATLIDNLRCQL